MLPYHSPQQEPYLNKYKSSVCEMPGCDRILPLAWLYWAEFHNVLVQEFGEDLVGNWTNTAKWLATETASGLLNAVELVSQIE